MKRVERGPVFETNSSSVHTIVIEGGEYIPDKLYINEEGIIVIYPGEFGWEDDYFSDPAGKASYCLTFCKQFKQEAKLDLIKEVIEEVTGAEVRFTPSHDEYYPWGYIDHQSVDVPSEAFESKETLRDFIFNPKSKLETGNDNSGKFADLWY